MTKVQGFRGTICDVNLPDYVLRKIDGVPQPEVVEAWIVLQHLKASVETLVKALWWKDFELLVHLIFAKSGWQRISVLGKTEKDIDLDAFSPVTQRRAFVQVKSSTNRAQIEACCEMFLQYAQYDEMYFVYHSLDDAVSSINIHDHRVHLWDMSRVAELVIYAGLVDWLITKRS